MTKDKSRIQSCIDHINTAVDVDPWAKELVIEMGAEILKQLTNSNDAISRQAAIDTEGLDEQIRCEMCRNPMRTDRGCDGNCQYDEKLHERIMQILDERIKPLPSVQPERTCVNCGRTANNGGWYADGRTRCPIEEHYALPKDGYCHLWEKRNVTDDDYPERREE